jgi:hypothetical protein
MNKYNLNHQIIRREIADKENTPDNVKENNQDKKSSKDNYQLKNKNKEIKDV